MKKTTSSDVNTSEPSAKTPTKPPTKTYNSENDYGIGPGLADGVGELEIPPNDSDDEIIGNVIEGGEILGIDIGNEYISIGKFEQNRVDIIQNNFNHNKTPNYISYSKNIKTGELGKKEMGRNPNNTIYNIIRLLGNTYQELKASKIINNLPFKVEEDSNSKKPIIIKKDKKNNNTENIHPEEALSKILIDLFDQAKLNKENTNVLASIPAYFNKDQKNDIKKAFELAGINLIKIATEPESASFSYGYHNKIEKPKIIFVFDLGAGNLDLSILRVSKSSYEVLASDGLKNIGGEDFDNKLIDYSMKEVEEKEHISFKEEKNIHYYRQLFKKECENAKKLLSSSIDSDIKFEFPFKGEEYSTTINISRSFFEENLVNELINKCLDKTNSFIKSYREKIDEIILLGGSSRIPKIYHGISSLISNKPIIKTIDPDEGNVIGATLYCAKLCGVDEFKDLKILKSNAQKRNP